MKTPILFLVDDDEDDRMFLRGAVQEIVENVNIIECNSGVDFLEMAISSKQMTESILVIMDINMPRMTGIETILEFRTSPQFVNIPIIVISTSSNPELQEQAYAAGAAGYLIKPSSSLGLTEIAKVIKGHIEKLF